MSRPLVSVIVPMHNEVDNVGSTLTALADVLQAEGWTYELIPVNDGSTDRTGEALRVIADGDASVRPVDYSVNRGRGYALRRGFAVARGEIVVTMDADLSYTPDHAARMVRILLEDPEADIVLASPYMPGGAVEDVPFVRLALSRIGNAVLRNVLPAVIYTSTGIVRAYRAPVVRALDVTSDGKEIHLEILSEALDLGYRIVEMPAVLRTRKRGTSKFKPKSTIISHLLFGLVERAASVFYVAGLLFLGTSMATGAYLFTVYLGGGLNPERPLMTVVVVLFLGGALVLAFAVLAVLLLGLRRDMVRMHGDVLRLKAQLAEERASGTDGDG